MDAKKRSADSVAGEEPPCKVLRPPPFMPPRIVLFGDSITQWSFSVGGWGARLADRFQRRADVINRGFSGYNTRWALELLPQLSDAGGGMTRLVTVFFGANDASLADRNPRHHVPVEDYSANLRAIVAHLRAQCPRAEVLIICPPPVCEAQRLLLQKQCFPDTATGILERTNAATGKYAAAAEALAAQLGLPCLNLWSEMQRAAPGEGWHAFLCDGLHLSPRGNEVVAEMIGAKLEEAIPSLAVRPCEQTGSWANVGSRCEGLPQNAPWHDDIDPADPAKAFATANAAAPAGNGKPS